MSSLLYGTSDHLPYYMGVVFEENNPWLRCDLRPWSFPGPGPGACVDRRDLPFPPRWRRWPSVPEGTKRDDIDFYDPLGPPERCCSYDSCASHDIDRGSIWWRDYVCLKHEVDIRVNSVRLFLLKHDLNHSWLVIKLLSNSTDLAAVAIDPKSCWMLVDVLRRIMRSISEDRSYRGRSRSIEFPEILRDLSSVWLLLNCEAFYTMVLPDLVHELPHVSYKSLSYETCWFITKSTVLIVLHRISHNFQALIRGDGNGATFYEIVVRNDDWLFEKFNEAMEKCTPVTVLLSLFLPKAIVSAACRTFRKKIMEWHGFHHAIIVGALRCMTIARMSPSKLRAMTVAASTTADDAGDDEDGDDEDGDDEDGDDEDGDDEDGDDFFGTEMARLLLDLDARISQEGLLARSLLTLLRIYGIARVVRYFRKRSYVMPSSMWTIIHRYFYGVSWRFVCVMKYHNIVRQMAHTYTHTHQI